MTNISPASSTTFARPASAPDADQIVRPGEDRAAAPRREGDRVELSNRARIIAQLRDLPAVRTEVVDRVRGEITAGRYITDDRVDLAIDALVEELRFDAPGRA